ncbi:MAG: hypothetical protein ACI97A_000764 [Planctomycetota bacterium]|jgi:hypothetical protein
MQLCAPGEVYPSHEAISIQRNTFLDIGHE